MGLNAQHAELVWISPQVMTHPVKCKLWSGGRDSRTCIGWSCCFLSTCITSPFWLEITGLALATSFPLSHPWNVPFRKRRTETRACIGRGLRRGERRYRHLRFRFFLGSS